MAGLNDVLAGPVLEVAPRLLGATLTHAGVSLRLTEFENPVAVLSFRVPAPGR